MHRPTHVLIASFYRDNRGVSETFARPFGVSEKIPSSWGRPKPSDENPTGTGNGNPLDQGERLIRLVHPYDPARAREMAENYVALVDDLDGETGERCAASPEGIHQLLARSICEHSDVAAKLLDSELTRETLQKAIDEIREAKVALEQLEAGVKQRFRDIAVPTSMEHSTK